MIRIDTFKPLDEETSTGHNRWHEAMEPVVEVDPGDLVEYETRDAFDGQLNEVSAESDVANLDLGRVHALTGPAYVKGAEPRTCSRRRSWTSRRTPGGSGATR